MTLSKTQKVIVKGLEEGRRISQYPTGKHFDAMLRWDDTKEVVNVKTVMSLKRKGFELNIEIKEEVVC